MATTRPTRPELKGRPPLRKCPDDFEVIFVEQGRVGCEAWYRARRSTVDRWLTKCGKVKLIERRAAYVSHQRAAGNWLTRSSSLVKTTVRKAERVVTIRDRRKVSFTLARHAAQFLRTMRNGGWIVSPTPHGDWWVGSKRLSAAQMLELACGRGFDAEAASLQDDVFQEAKIKIGGRHGTAEQREEYDRDLRARMSGQRTGADLRLGRGWQERNAGLQADDTDEVKF